MELCTTEQISVKKLDPKQTAAIIKQTAVPCDKRKIDIHKMITSSQLNTDPILRNYNIELKFDMACLVGKVLNAPDLEYGNKIITTSGVIGSKGQWDNVNKPFYETKEMGSWIILNCARRMYDDALHGFLGSLMNVASTHGIRMKEPLEIIKVNANMDERRARELLVKTNDKYKNLEFIMAILPGTSTFYSKSH